MKKTLLSALAVCGILLSANAQTTNSDVSGNKPTASGEGYAFNWNIGTVAAGNPNVYNCMSVADDKYNIFGTAGFTVTLNTTDSALTVNYTTSSAIMSNRLQQGNCANVQIDLSSSFDLGLTAIVKSSVNLPKLIIGVATLQGTNFQVVDDPSVLKSVSLTAGVEKIVHFDIPTKGFFSGAFNTVDLSKTLGWWLQTQTANQGTDADFSGVLTIKQITIGDAPQPTPTAVNKAVLPSSVSYYPNPSNSVITVDNINVNSLKLINTNGVVVKEVSSVSTISVEGLNPGMYFLQINEFKPVKVNVQ